MIIKHEHNSPLFRDMFPNDKDMRWFSAFLVALFALCSFGLFAVALAQDVDDFESSRDKPEVVDVADDGDADTGDDTVEQSQEPVSDGPVIRPGSIAVTGFSGTKFPSGGLKPGVNPIDETFIAPKGKTLRIFQVEHAGEPPKGQLIYTPPPFEVEAEKIGQVFGLAYDDGKQDNGSLGAPNLYVGATSLHGIQIVVPDSDDDGRPERVTSGSDDAKFMEGQHGDRLNGGPGSIYKIDGTTGDVTLFADVRLDGTDNSGPGLGNLAFDPVSRQLFVSDLDTGMIHRFNMNGEDRGTFDHGVNGREAAGLAAVAHDADARMDITSKSFKSEDPETWGYAAPERLVHGVGVKGRRLYYAVYDGLQIWSVGIGPEGDFDDDPHKELDVVTDTDYAITDIAFDDKGMMYVAQRGRVKNAYDYAAFAESERAQVFRYKREYPDDPSTPSEWVETPQVYAVGFHRDNRMGLGGIDLGYGYDKDGYFDRDSCKDTLGKTGDDLRFNKDLGEKLAEGGPFHVHGFQLTKTPYVRPENVPPWKSYFVDFDGRFEDPEVRGHVGDIEIWNPCQGKMGWGDGYPGYVPELLPPYCEGEGCPPPVAPKCVEVEHVFYQCNPGGIDAFVWLKDKAGIGADSVKAQSLNPAISVSPGMQTLADPSDPYFFDIGGALPGDKVNINICHYKGADAVPGDTFTCCKAQLPLTLPPDVCAP